MSRIEILPFTLDSKNFPGKTGLRFQFFDGHFYCDRPKIKNRIRASETSGALPISGMLQETNHAESRVSIVAAKYESLSWMVRQMNNSKGRRQSNGIAAAEQKRTSSSSLILKPSQTEWRPHFHLFCSERRDSYATQIKGADQPTLQDRSDVRFRPEFLNQNWEKFDRLLRAMDCVRLSRLWCNNFEIGLESVLRYVGQIARIWQTAELERFENKSRLEDNYYNISTDVSAFKKKGLDSMAELFKYWRNYLQKVEQSKIINDSSAHRISKEHGDSNAGVSNIIAIPRTLLNLRYQYSSDYYDQPSVRFDRYPSLSKNRQEVLALYPFWLRNMTFWFSSKIHGFLKEVEEANYALETVGLKTVRIGKSSPSCLWSAFSSHPTLHKYKELLPFISLTQNQKHDRLAGHLREGRVWRDKSEALTYQMTALRDPDFCKVNIVTVQQKTCSHNKSYHYHINHSNEKNIRHALDGTLKKKKRHPLSDQLDIRIRPPLRFSSLDPSLRVRRAAMVCIWHIIFNSF
ncbi:unnamed protein product [Nesidiocoris tenuis]|uniref:Uncharacterized protein n=1 Tax=Nesidiocoris tenuis TaxID=355587 RepID=A0A6H5GB25_9HEMI|nr:unnamed protein product [Nesidiocoris tenuis]